MPNERLILVSDEHWIKYVVPSVMYLILAVTGVALVSGSVIVPIDVGFAPVTFCTGLILLTCVHHWFFWFLLSELQVDIIVTNKRFVYMHAGLLWDEDIVEISFEKLKAIEVHKKSLLQSILNYGTLNFEGKARITRVPHPGTIARKIQQAMGMI